MFSFVWRKHLTAGGPTWRCLQQVIRPPNCQHLHNQASSSSSLLSRAASINKRWSLTPITSRLCHHRNQHGTPKREEVFSMKTLTQAPKPALYVGLSSLAPFLCAPAFMAATQSFCPEVAFSQVIYGACVVSFLGGARWGFALPQGSPAQPDWMNLGNGLVPALLAWLALLLCRDNVTEAALVVVMGLGLSLHYDLTLLPGYPAWFRAMRTVLTLVATVSLVATLAFKRFCPERKLNGP